MRIVAVIPARFTSSRFPGKLLEIAGGKTILQRTFENAKKCEDLDAVFVATDDERIARHIESFGGNVIRTSSNCPNGTARIAEAIEKTPLLQTTDFIVNLQGDHPCVHPSSISSMIRALEADPLANVSTVVTKILSFKDFTSPHIVKCVFDSSLYALYFSRSPIPYQVNCSLEYAYAHIGIYCFRRHYFKKFVTGSLSLLQKIEDLEQLKVLENGDRIKIAVVNEEILGIDTPSDLEKLKELLCQQNPLNISL